MSYYVCQIGPLYPIGFTCACSWIRLVTSQDEPGRCVHSQTGCITATNRIELVLFGMQNRTFSPHLAAIHRILVPAILVPAMMKSLGQPVATPNSLDHH
jgi:hypothetical protein